MPPRCITDSPHTHSPGGALGPVSATHPQIGRVSPGSAQFTKAKIRVSPRGALRGQAWLAVGGQAWRLSLSRVLVVAAAHCGSAHKKSLETKAKEKQIVQGCVPRCNYLEKEVRKGQIKSHLMIQTSDLTSLVNSVTLTGLMLRKSQKGLSDANCFGHRHPGLGPPWALLPKEVTASGSSGVRITGNRLQHCAFTLGSVLPCSLPHLFLP